MQDIEPTLRALRSRFKHHSNPWGDMAVHYATGLVAMNGKAGGATEDIRLKAQSHLADVTVASQTDLIKSVYELIFSPGSSQVSGTDIRTLIYSCFFKWLLSINGATGAYLPLLYQLCRDLKSRATIVSEILAKYPPSLVTLINALLIDFEYRQMNINQF